MINVAKKVDKAFLKFIREEGRDETKQASKKWQEQQQQQPPQPQGAFKGALSAPLLSLPQRLARHALRWFGSRHPSVWLVLAVLAVHSRGRLDKRFDMRTFKNQVSSDEYHITIVTTAALPWMTGTAVNPALRAAHLALVGKRVTLCVPWLHPLEQSLVFPSDLRFKSPVEQEAHVRRWLLERAGVRAHFGIVFYPARYDQERGSILPLGDITHFIASEERDIAVLEEPEHLTWYHNGPNWRHRFKLVVGVVHTNYLYYASTWANGGPLLAQTLKQVNFWVCRAYCDKVIKLSDTIQPLPRAVVCNVHGVRRDFLEIGRRAGLPFTASARAPTFWERCSGQRATVCSSSTCYSREHEAPS